jgi:selenocysteine-specific elongation factor
MLLVIDITKGIQTQTAECLIIGEITCDKMLVVLNKIDLIEENQRQLTIDKVGKKKNLS